MVGGWSASLIENKANFVSNLTEFDLKLICFIVLVIDPNKFTLEDYFTMRLIGTIHVTLVGWLLAELGLRPTKHSSDETPQGTKH